jgi:ABC-2 type transport system ATP-binding protein
MIEVNDVTKSYERQRGLRSMNLAVAPGELVGLVGPNGAGKTTLIKVLATLLRADSGMVRVQGLDVAVQREAVRKVIGYMPDISGVYQDMKVREFLLFFADAYHLPSVRKKAAVDESLEWAGLADRAESFVEHLSLGWKQRLLLAKTLLHRPALLLLDEPATGLDPLARLELRMQLKDLHQRGVTILVSSHILSDLEDVCTRIVFIAEGANVGESATQNGTAGLGAPPPPAPIYEIEYLSSSQAVEIAAGVRGAQILTSSDVSLRLALPGGREQVAEVVRSLVTAGVSVTRIQPASELETQYQQLFGARQ